MRNYRTHSALGKSPTIPMTRRAGWKLFVVAILSCLIIPTSASADINYWKALYREKMEEWLKSPWNRGMQTSGQKIWEALSTGETWENFKPLGPDVTCTNFEKLNNFTGVNPSRIGFSGWKTAFRFVKFLESSVMKDYPDEGPETPEEMLAFANELINDEWVRNSFKHPSIKAVFLEDKFLTILHTTDNTKIQKCGNISHKGFMGGIPSIKYAWSDNGLMVLGCKKCKEEKGERNLMCRRIGAEAEGEWISQSYYLELKRFEDNEYDNPYMSGNDCRHRYKGTTLTTYLWITNDQTYPIDFTIGCDSCCQTSGDPTGKGRLYKKFYDHPRLFKVKTTREESLRGSRRIYEYKMLNDTRFIRRNRKWVRKPTVITPKKGKKKTSKRRLMMTKDILMQRILNAEHSGSLKHDA